MTDFELSGEDKARKDVAGFEYIEKKSESEIIKDLAEENCNSSKTSMIMVML